MVFHFFLQYLLIVPLWANVKIGFIEAFQAASEKTESVQIKQKQLEQSEEKITQSYGGLLPNVSASASYLMQAEPTTGSASSISNPTQSTAKLTATQPLFHGFREFAAIRQLNSEAVAGQMGVDQAKLTLYTQVAKSYYDVLAAEQDLVNLNTLLDLTLKRVVELKERNRIGRSRKGEVLSAESQVASLRAQVEAGKTQISLARDSLAVATGLNREATLLDDSDLIPTTVESITNYLGRLSERPDVQAYQAQMTGADEAIWVAKGAHLPSLDLSGNYYLRRSGLLENTKWDVTLNLSIPLFQGGAVVSQTRSAVAQFQQSELAFAQGRRAAEREIRSYYETFSNGLVEIHSLKEAVVAAEDNFKEQNRDYRLGLVTNLEVLQAINTFQETKRTLDRKRFQIKTAWLSLQAAVGKIPHAKGI